MLNIFYFIILSPKKCFKRCNDCSLKTNHYSCQQQQTSFSKRILSKWQFWKHHCLTLAAVGQMVCFRAHFWVSIALRLQYCIPHVLKFSKFMGSNMAAKPQFSSMQQCCQKGNCHVHKHAVLPENLISIRICSRDPGQRILVKQHLVGIGSDQFAISRDLAMVVATCFLAATMCFFIFGACS